MDANGIQPTKVGALPAHLAALMQTNINVQTLLTQAILTENRDYVYYATMMDPHTAAVLGSKRSTRWWTIDRQPRRLAAGRLHR